MKILVTGNLGYVGSVLCPHLSFRKHSVYGLDAGFYRDNLLCPVEDPPTLRKDVRDVTAGDLAGFDAVVHLAALSNDPTGDLDPHLTDDINHRASVRLGELARRAGVRRFVFASSCSMYGAAGGDALDETAGFNPQTAYARSKVDAEAGLGALASDGFSPTFLRFATAYGLSPRLRLDIVVNNLTGWAVATGVVNILSDGSPWRPLVHVADMARAVTAALEAPREVIHNEAFNVGKDEDNYQVRDIARAVQRGVPGSRVEFAGGAGADTRTYKVSFRKVGARLPEFQPGGSIDAAVKELYEHYTRHGMSLERFHSKEFIRLKQLRALMEAGRVDKALRWK